MGTDLLPKDLDNQLVGPRVRAPIDASQIVARLIVAVFQKLDALTRAARQLRTH
jgi:hypothetical protein